MNRHYDVIIIGTGGGRRHAGPSPGSLGQAHPAARARRLASRGPENWSTVDVFVDGRYVSPDSWYDPKAKSFFQPQVHYFVGGATKLYGAALYRMRAEDFGELHHHDGLSPAWPISYQDMEPYYTAAETMYQVHGARGEDHTEPPCGAPYPYPAVSHEPRIQQLSDDLAASGFHSFHAPPAARTRPEPYGSARTRPHRCSTPIAGPTNSTTSTSRTPASSRASARSTQPSPRWPTPSGSATTCSNGSADRSDGSCPLVTSTASGPLSPSRSRWHHPDWAAAGVVASSLADGVP